MWHSKRHLTVDSCTQALQSAHQVPNCNSFSADSKETVNKNRNKGKFYHKANVKQNENGAKVFLLFHFPRTFAFIALLLLEKKAGCCSQATVVSATEKGNDKHKHGKCIGEEREKGRWLALARAKQNSEMLVWKKMRKCFGCNMRADSWVWAAQTMPLLLLYAPTS